MTQTPFPTVFELIRFIAVSFDTKASNKELDDLARDVFADYREVEPIFYRIVKEPLSKYVNPVFAQELGVQLGKLLENYLELVSQWTNKRAGVASFSFALVCTECD